MELPEEAEPCKEGDHGKFEVSARDGWARIGELHTSTHMLDTPTLLPVVNPNLQTVTPADLWEMGFYGLITNSYIIHNSEKWKQKALDVGVHEMLDYPGLIMTDSGTFQQYIYGDEIEVSPTEIVEFQKEIGVDIATMLDVFGRPDMTREELEEAVRITAERGPESIEAAGDTLLNGPIQGGTHPDLRASAAIRMSAMDFAVHPIGGIVPLMENQRYRDLVEIILNVKQNLTPERPVHLFGCGHPILFPISIALGVDLFDSAAYVLFARDGRLLTPTGTVKLEGLKEWPHTSHFLWDTTPEKVRKMDDEERVKLLSLHNLSVTHSELARCRAAVRNGTIWRLVEERSHCNSHLREATEWLYDNMPEDLIQASKPCRTGGVDFSNDIAFHPRIKHANELLIPHWYPAPCDHLGNPWYHVDWWGVVFHGCQGPWRERIGPLVERVIQRWPRVMPFVYTPLGVIPYQLEDLNPFAHIVGPESLWGIPAEMLNDEDEDEYEATLIHHVQQLVDLPPGDVISHDVRLPEDELFAALTELIGDGEEVADPTISATSHLQRWGVRDKIAYFTQCNSWAFEEDTPRFEFVWSRTGRITNVLLDGVHLFSPRLTDGGISLTMEGAKYLHERRGWTEYNEYMALGFMNRDESDFDYFGNHLLIPEVIVNSDAEPFIRKGRNVMHGFITGGNGSVRVGMPCLVVNQDDELLAHGIAQGDGRDMMAFRKGVAVKVKDGVGLEGD
jgi:7-cyano-7-deazaguanine tRNA-ribosyltransferase